MEHIEKRKGERVAAKYSSRVRSVKAVSGTALNGENKTIFALVNQRRKHILNQTVSCTSRSKEARENGIAPAMEVIDKYTVNRSETGIHAAPWDSSEILAERLNKDVRLVPQRKSRLVPMTSKDIHKDTSYKNRSALNAGESITEKPTDDFGRRRVKSNARVTRVRDESLSELDGY